MFAIRRFVGVALTKTTRTTTHHGLARNHALITSQHYATHRSNNNNNRSSNKRLPSDDAPQPSSLPQLVYVPNVFAWLRVKCRMRYLRRRFDPHFTEGSFIYGSQVALCRIADIIANACSSNQQQQQEQNNNGGSSDSNAISRQLDGLVTGECRGAILRLIERSRTSSMRLDLLRIRPIDIQLMVPLDVVFEEEESIVAMDTAAATPVWCCVLVKCYAMRWHRQGPLDEGQSGGGGGEKSRRELVLAIVESRFRRRYERRYGGDYHEDENVGDMAFGGDWTIDLFEVKECKVMRC